MKERCPGPKRTPGALEDTTVPVGSKDRWINNPHQPSIEVCEHGYQYAHPIKKGGKKRGNK